MLCAGLTAATMAVLCNASALASDRPFLATASAAAEEDDDNVWSVETVFQRLGPVRRFGVAPEYTFNPTTALQLEFARVRDRAAGETMQLSELEFKHLFNHIARDGYGVGVVASVGFGRSQSGSFRREEWGLAVPFTLALFEGGAALHLNAGASWPRGERREWNRTFALEHEVWKRTTLFGEIARLGEAMLVHAGVRHWLRREKLALDLSVQRVRADGARESGVVIGLGWYDL